MTTALPLTVSPSLLFDLCHHDTLCLLRDPYSSSTNSSGSTALCQSVIESIKRGECECSASHDIVSSEPATDDEAACRRSVTERVYMASAPIATSRQ